MKKTMVLLLALLLVCSVFAGCSGDSGSSVDAGTSSSRVSTGEESTADSQTEKSSMADSGGSNREETVQLKMCAFYWGGDLNALDDVEEEMNAITRESLNIEVDLQFFDAASYQQQLTLMLAGGEQVDLYNTFIMGYGASVDKGYVVDVEQDGLLETYGKGIIDTMGMDFIEACRYQGGIYCLPNQRDLARGIDAFAIGAQFLDGIEYEYSDDNIIYTDIDEINDIFAKLHETYPDMDVIVPPSASSAVASVSIPVDDVGGDSFGVLLNYGQDSLEVVDLFSSDAYFDYCSRYYNWNQLGYISGDAATNDVSPTTQVSNGTAMAYEVITKPGIRIQESSSSGQEVVIFQVGKDFLRSDAVSGVAWCMSVNSIDKVAAMEYLNELYTNEELSTLLCWGREGEEYVVTDDGHLTFPEGVTMETSGYSHAVNWQMPNQYIAGIWEGNDLDLWEQTQAFNDDAVRSKAFGFVFDNAPVSTTFTALSNIYSEYNKQLEYGFTDPEVGIPLLVERLKSSGLDDYIAEKQSQLDAWAAEAGVS